MKSTDKANKENVQKMIYKRRSIPRETKHKIHQEAFGHCAFPGCKESQSVQIAHIKPVSEGGSNNFYNLILLCDCCHRKFDNGKHIESGSTRKNLFILKKNLMRLNSMYCSFELRLLEYFLENPDIESKMLVEHEIEVMYLVRDGLITDDGKRYINMLGLTQKNYCLTNKGKDLLDAFKYIKDLEMSESST